MLSPHFLRLYSLRDPDFAKSKLSYRGRRSRRLCKILTFPLHSCLLMLLSLIIESIISCSGRTFRAPRHLGDCIKLLPFVTLWIQFKRLRTLRIQGPNKSATKNTKRGAVKGRSHDAQLQILFQLSQEFANFSLLFMIRFLSCWPMFLTIPDRFT